MLDGLYDSIRFLVANRKLTPSASFVLSDHYFLGISPIPSLCPGLLDIVIPLFLCLRFSRIATQAARSPSGRDLFELSRELSQRLLLFAGRFIYARSWAVALHSKIEIAREHFEKPGLYRAFSHHPGLFCVGAVAFYSARRSLILAWSDIEEQNDSAYHFRMRKGPRSWPHEPDDLSSRRTP